MHRNNSIRSALFALNPLKGSNCFVRASIIPIESKRPYSPVDDIPSLMDGWRDLDLGFHVWIQDGFNIEEESRQESWAVKRRDGRYFFRSTSAPRESTGLRTPRPPRVRTWVETMVVLTSL